MYKSSKLSFSELSNLFRDTYRIPGGYSTDCYIATSTMINPNSRVLLVGNVSTAINLSRGYGCDFHVVDSSIKNCERYREWIEQEKLSEKISVFCADVAEMDFENYYDVVILGNVLSLVKDCRKAIQKSVDALKNGGRLSVTPIYESNQTNSKECLINSHEFNKIPNKKTLIDWKEMFKIDNLVFRASSTSSFLCLANEQIEDYITYIFLKSEKEISDNIKNQYREYVYDLCHNLSSMKFTNLIYTKETINCEPELFLSENGIF